MKDLKTQRRLAADILGVGENKIYMDPLRAEDISQAITRADIAELIKDKAIIRKMAIGQKRKKTARTKRAGSIKMRVQGRKRRYIYKIRKIRRYLSELRENKNISNEEHAYIRKLAKAGQFKSRRHLKEYLTGVLKKNIEHEKTNKSTIQKKTGK